MTICTRNRPQLLIETVESVLKGDELPREIVIVDQSDTPDQATAKLKSDKCKIRYFWNQSVGVGRSRNLAISASQHDLLVLTDDDIRVTATWFSTLVRALIEAGPRSVVTGKVLAAEAETSGGFAPSTIADDQPAVYVGRVGKDVLFTGNMAMFRSAIEEIGTFDERLGAGAPFPAAYDNDFGFRLLEAGYRVLYVPNAVLYHRAWRPSRDYGKLRWNYGRGQGAFYAKHLRLRDLHMLRRLVSDVSRRLIWLALRIWHRPRQARGELSYISGLLSGAGEWLWTQRKVG